MNKAPPSRPGFQYKRQWCSEMVIKNSVKGQQSAAENPFWESDFYKLIVFEFKDQRNSFHIDGTAHPLRPRVLRLPGCQEAY